jgi:hypothetical protein
MPSIPTPDAFLLQVLVWLGAPTLFVFLVSLAITSASWINTTRDVAKYSAAAGRSITTMVREKSSAQFRARVKLVFAGGAFVALVFSGAKFGPLMFEPDASGYSLSSGVLYDMSEVWPRILGYENWTPLSQWATLGALASVVLLLFARLSGWGALQVPLYIAWVPIFVAGFGLGAITALVGLLVLIMGLFHTSGYTVEMAQLYGVWVAISWGIPFLGTQILWLSEEAFPGPRRRE